MADSVVPFKIYFIHNDLVEDEIRRFGLPASEVSFQNLSRTITELCPNVASKGFKVYWEDEDGDRVAISSDVEFIIALKSMNSGTRKFYVKLESSAQGLPEDENLVAHPGIYCDGCESDVVGFRYKCLICPDYDLCKSCEHAGIHPEHPMIKIPHPVCFDRVQLKKLTEYLSSYIPLRVSNWPQRRRHSHESESQKRKKRSENRDPSHEASEEMGEGHKKHSKKCKKSNACPYSPIVEYFIPHNFEGKNASKKSQEQSGHLTYLKSIASTVQKLLDPLGVNVEFEVRPNCKNSEAGKEERQGAEKGEENRKKEKEPTPDFTPSAPKQKEVQFLSEPTPDFTPSASKQKEVQFFSPEQIAETVRQGIEEITKSLANQKMSNGNPADDGWVSFEELKRGSDESRRGSVENIPKPSQQEGSSTQTDRVAPGTSAEVKNPDNLYPDLTSLNQKVAESLEQMLAMGFSNEGNLLSCLLKAKEGSIERTLEALAADKNN